MDHRKRLVDRVIARAERDPDVLAVMQYGSTVLGEATEDSDVDVCLLLEDRPFDDLQMSKKRLSYLTVAEVDLRIFQQMPLYVRRRVIDHGKIVYVADEDRLYDLAFKNAREYEHYKHHYFDYLDEVARGRP